MTFDGKFNLTDKMSFKQRYETIVNGLGYEAVKRCIPFSREEITEALKTDLYLNNLNIHTWELAADYIPKPDGTYDRAPLRYDGLQNLCLSNGVDCYSPSELVCILKRCAVMWAEEST